MLSVPKPGADYVRVLRQAEAQIRGKICAWYAGEVVRNTALADLLERLETIVQEMSLSGWQLVMAFLTQLSGNCRRIVCRHRLFDNPEDFGRAVRDAAEEGMRAAGGEEGRLFLQESCDLLEGGYLECFILLVYPGDSARLGAVRELRECLAIAEVRASATWQGFAFGYYLSGIREFSAQGQDFSGPEDFIARISALRESDFRAYADFAAASLSDIAVLSAIIRDPGFRSFAGILRNAGTPAVFTEDHLYFGSSSDFADYAERLIRDGDYSRLRYLFKRYHCALRMLDTGYWKSGIFDRIARELEGSGGFGAMFSGLLEKLSPSPSIWNTGHIVVSDTFLSAPKRVSGFFPEYHSSDYVPLGTWEQEEGSPAPIEWMVLEVTRDYALLLSRQGLEVRSLHENAEVTRWKDSSLCRWLNTEFLARAFSDDDRKLLFTDRSLPDPVFLISVREFRMIPITLARGMFGYREGERTGNRNSGNEPMFWQRLCSPTPHAFKGNPELSRDRRFAPWWLREPAGAGSFSAILSDGSVSALPADTAGIMVRPAVRLKL